MAVYNEGASFILVDFPRGSSFGIDCHSWIVGENFRGIKNIPPGWHIISCCSSNKSGELSNSLISFYHKFSAKEIFIKKWNQTAEEFDSSVPTSGEIERFQSNITEVEHYLGPYPLEQHRKWLSLSSFIDDHVIGMLTPSCGFIFSVTQFMSEKITFSKSQRSQGPSNDVPPADLAQAEARLPKLTQDESATIKYSMINRRVFEAGATPSAISLNSMDGSYHLEHLFAERFSNCYTSFLGELQFAFVSFLICQNYDSFEQWKTIIELVCSCDEILSKNPQFFLDFLKVLYYQLKEVPADFFVDIVSANNFLTVTLHRFFSNVESSTDAPASLKHRAAKFKKHVTSQFKWDFSAELPEDQPVVVDM